MKAITLIVEPCSSSLSVSGVAANPTQRGETDDASSPQPGPLQIELRLSDARADLLVAIIMEMKRPDESVSNAALIEMLVQNQLQAMSNAGGDNYDGIYSLVEKTVIRHVFEACHRVQTRTAVRLGIDRNTLYKKLRKYQLLRNDRDEPTVPNDSNLT